MMREETILEIGESIKENTDKFSTIIRANCVFPKFRGYDGICWIMNTSNGTNPRQRRYYKNTPFGEALICAKNGKTKYYAPGGWIDLDILNYASYIPSYKGVKDITIYTPEGKHMFNSIFDIFRNKKAIDTTLEAERKKAAEEKAHQAEIKAAAERAKREKEEAERRAKEAAERAKQEAANEAARVEAERLAKEREEAERKEAEARRAAEEAEKREERIAQLEEAQKQAEEAVTIANRFIINDFSLRLRPDLDPSQESAKRRHIFDDVPVVIEGGPGTGKTTTVVQRLKFLISREVVDEYENTLTPDQKNRLTDPAMVNNNWLFFSPTKQLLGFLRDFMQREELRANENNTTVLSVFDKDILKAYKLRNPDKDGPFRLTNKEEELKKQMIKNPKTVVSAFERYCIKEITKKMLAAYQLNTAGYKWHHYAVEIKALCQRAEKISDMDALMRLVNSLQDNYRPLCNRLERDLDKEVQQIAIRLEETIENDEHKVQNLTDLFTRWKNETIVTMDDDEEDEEEEAEVANTIDFSTELFKNLKKFIRRYCLLDYDSKLKLGKRNNEMLAFISDLLNTVDMKEAGELAWFVRNYSVLCKGIASAILNQFTRLYKGFRKQLLDLGSTAYNKTLLERYIKKENKPIHPDELHLLVGFINRQLLSIYKKSRLRFDAMKNHKFMQAYNQYVKHVIGIDEATDYSWLDYYYMTSFQHYEFSSITLCGDEMQALTNTGITSWHDLDDLLPKLEIHPLQVSYRQSSALVDMARQMYLDDRGTEAPYNIEDDRRYGNEAAPIAFISDDMEEQVTWMSKRIIEVYMKYGEQMPSVAILVGDDVNIKEMVDTFQELDYLNGIEVVDCSDGRTSATTKCVRIIRMREVKGMEFEVAFFHNADKALQHATTDLMRHYLYVGISRASSHMAATFSEEDGNEDILKYFNRNVNNWKI